jgi:V/A-type H+-transporting ATPase subunit D
VATKFKLTRPELKRFRDALSRYQRYLPMLKLKQQQLQTMLREVARHCREAAASVREATETFRRYEAVLADVAGLPVPALAEPREIRTSQSNVAGVNIPVFEEAVFPKAVYSLFGTPAWVDQALADLRERNTRQARLDVLTEQHNLLSRELTRIVQRVNLFEKVKIPEAQKAIRVIRIKLGDEMTAAVGRAKIAKTKLADVMESAPGEAVTVGLEDMAENGGPSS